MQVKANKIDGANAQIDASIPKDVVEKNIDKVAKELSKSANIQGFRKGKAPVNVIKKQFGDKLVQDAESEALRDVLNQGLKELDVAMDALLGEPMITKFDKAEDKIEVSVKVAMRPTIKLDAYAELVESFDKPQVSDEKVDERVAKIAEAHAKYVEIKEPRAAQDGDSVTIDFEGSVDGEIFEGGTAKEYDLVLGSAQFIPGFEEQLVGMNVGEERVIKVTFPAEYGSEKLAGKDSEFKINLHAIKEKKAVAIDEEFAAKVLVGQEDNSLENLKSQVKKQLEHEALMKLYNEDLKPALLEKLVDSLEFDLPQFVVEQEIDVHVNKKASGMSEDEINELRDDKSKLDALRDTFREDATKSVKATFIIDALAKDQDVKVSESDVMQTIYYEAMQMGQDPKQAYDYYKDSGYLPAIQMSIVEDKVLSKILDAKMKA
ncbi:MAG: trigger factor [Sulfurimonas sp.]|jgi:trigger factor|nr:trigger factor [Sulfurimonadaceae bacterium]